MNLDDEDVRNYLLDSDDTDKDSDFIPGSEDSSSDITPEEPTSLLVQEEKNDSTVEEEHDEDGEVQACENKPFKPRKRQKHESRRAKAKRLRSLGQSYVNVKGNVIQGKTFQNTSCECRMNCNTKITEQERQKQFENFNLMGNFGKQNAFLCGLVHQAPVVNKRPRSGERGNKKCTNLFHVKNGDVTVRVCKKYFLQTFGVSDGRITRALKKVTDGHIPGEDLRGKHVAAKKITDQQTQYVMDHIRSFPAFDSHYTRIQNPNRKYLRPDLNITQMYDLYKTWCLDNQTNPVKEYYYRHVFNNKFNLQFHTPRKDTCKICDKFSLKVKGEDDPEKKAELVREHQLHLRKSEKARACLEADTKLAKDEEGVYTITMDLQKALPFPRLTVSEAYYRRNMYCYNLGIHDTASNQGYMYVWDETIAGRGSQEISACLTKHIKQHPCKRIIVYSDSCGGQNRNINVALSLMLIIQETEVEVIDQKFMTPGHSFLPNDTDFGNIEKSAKNKTIYIPDDWYKEIVSARRTNKFMLVRMNQEEILSTDKLSKAITKRKVNVEKDKVNWLKIQWLRYEKKREFSILYKYTLEEDVAFQELNVKSAKQGRPQNLTSVEKNKLYNGPRTISDLKKRDMIYLLKYIPPVNHAFFRNLKSSREVQDLGFLSDNEEFEESDEEN